ncbi:unnamed protein product [Rotaria socialis]|uniref:Factor VIII intron 22 protein n=1 Tax=Rotaria socialis TaxID=392032 RepID=A0A818E914_9BILA|nr:unnamed protein product [Rotaria socialis]CAF3316592.1 unnamed protein product [Rotaria socialis]CAF3453549.1 unnamed protein product [Rotaria socialis]CAF3457679.1 unnamed protein product [Rotaria socialis]CAF3521818.1 unnamed protein product [Rotaria socialis]
MDPTIDHIERLRTIYGKLKKVRFGGVVTSRKPKYAEAALDFQSLSRQFRQENCLEYAGLCLIQSSRCFSELKSSTSELQMLLEATSIFIEIELQLKDTNTLSYHENLSLALSVYQLAQKNLREQNERYLAGLITFQVGLHLEALEKFQESERLFSMALDSFQDLLSIQICIYQRLINIRIDNENYNLALQTTTSLIERLMKTSTNDISYRCLLANYDVVRLFLLLILQPHPQRLRSDYAKALDAYTWESYEKLDIPMSYLDETLFYLLQSITLAIQAKDLKHIEQLEYDLNQQTQINSRHIHLFHKLKQKISGHFIDTFKFDQHTSTSNDITEYR